MRRFIPILVCGALGLLSVFSTLRPAANSTVIQADIDSGDTAWMLTASALVLLMTPGLSFFYGGMVQGKNVIATMLQSFLAMGVVSLLWIFVGFSLSFGDSFHGLIGNPLSFFLFQNVTAAPAPAFAATIPFTLFALFQLKFAIITPALVTGAFAERIRFSSFLAFVALFTIFIYAPLAHWTWHPDGFLRQLGVLDFAGGTVVHMSAGFAAIAGAIVTGPRKSFATAKSHEPAHIPYVMLGTGMLWFGWFGFNAGSALAANGLAAQAFLTTNTASAAAMLGWLACDIAAKRKPSALNACIGAVVGLVAITPAAGFVSVGSSVLIGFIASGISNLAVHLKSKSSIDDTLDVFACHGVGGMVGMILTAVFAEQGGLITGETHLFGVHMLGLIIVSAYSFIGSFAIFKAISLAAPLRVSSESEAQGLDRAEHGESIYNSLPISAQITVEKAERIVNPQLSDSILIHAQKQIQTGSKLRTGAGYAGVSNPTRPVSDDLYED